VSTSADPLLSLAVALAIGLLIGLERGWHEREREEGGRVAGLRTFGLIGLLGGATGLLATEMASSLLLGLAGLGVAAALIAGHLRARRDRRDVSITSLIAGLVTFALGAATVLGYAMEAAATAVVAALLLGYKPELHRWVRAIEAEELRSALKLLLISVVVLPILPDRGFGPYQALNPYDIWWMVVLISAISFAGYLAIKIIGVSKGALVTGLLAGLASSTALTLHFSRLARRRPELTPMLAPAILLACGTMFPRMLLVASLVAPGMFRPLILPAGTMAMAILTVALVMHRRGRPRQTEAVAPLSNPLQLGSALSFGLLLGVIMLMARWLEAEFEGAGVLVLAAVSGLSDVDAVTLTLSRMSGTEITITLAGFAVVLASAANSLAKGIMALAIGGRGLGLRVLGPLVLAGALGLAIAVMAGR